MLCCPRRRCRITQRISLSCQIIRLAVSGSRAPRRASPTSVSGSRPWRRAQTSGRHRCNYPTTPAGRNRTPFCTSSTIGACGCCGPPSTPATRTLPACCAESPTDGGRTWGPTHTLIPETDAGGVFVRQPITVLPSGRLLLPVFHCVRVPGRKWVGDRDYSGVLISDDGETWREVLVPDSIGCVHMNIGRLSNGIVGRAVPQPVGGPYLPKCVLRRRRDVVGSSRHRTAEQQLVDPVRGAAR